MGCTTTLDRGPWTKEPEPKTGRMAEALEVMERNGVPVDGAMRQQARMLDLGQTCEVKPSKKEFRSATDATEIPADEVCNIAPLTKRDAEELADLLQQCLQRLADAKTASERQAEPSWRWPAKDIRWTLTPHEVRKLARKRKGGAA